MGMFQPSRPVGVGPLAAIRPRKLTGPNAAVGRYQKKEGSGFGVQDLGVTTGSEVLNPEP